MLAKRIAVPGLQWAGILVLVTAVSLATGLRSAGAAEGWLVREQPGTLQYRLPESSAWSPASPGLELQPGTTVRAGSGRPAVLARADSSIAIRGGTELTLPPTGTETVVQRLGSARYQIEPGTVSDFLVETPYLMIGIKGTIFDVLVNEAGTKVEVSEGLVEVTTPDGRFRAQLAPGQSARVGAATGSAPEVQSNAGGGDAPAPQDSTRSAPPDQPSASDAASPVMQATAPRPTQAEVGGALSPLTSAARSLWSGIGDLLSDVEVVSDDHMTTRRPGTLVRTLSGGIASVGSGAGGDSGGGNSGDGSSSGTGGGGSSSGGGGSSGGGSGSSGSSSGGGSGSSGSGSGGGGRGGGLGGAVGGVSGAVGGAVGGVSSAVGGAVGGGLGSAVGGIGKGLGGAVGGLGNGGGKRGKR